MDHLKLTICILTGKLRRWLKGSMSLDIHTAVPGSFALGNIDLIEFARGKFQ